MLTYCKFCLSRISLCFFSALSFSSVHYRNMLYIVRNYFTYVNNFNGLFGEVPDNRFPILSSSIHFSSSFAQFYHPIIHCFLLRCFILINASKISNPPIQITSLVNYRYIINILYYRSIHCVS